MARVIRLPDGRVFRSEPLVQDATKLGMGNKGAFDFSETVKLLDQVAESKGIGALANIAEKSYDAIRGDVKRPGEPKKEITPSGDQGPADALTQAAKARVSQAGRRPPAPPEQQAPRREAEVSMPMQAPMQGQAQTDLGLRLAAEARLPPERRMDPRLLQSPLIDRMAQMPTEQVTELPEQQIEVRDDSVTRLTPRPERRLVQNTRAAIEAGGPAMVYEDQLARSPEGVVEQPKVPPLQVPGPAEVAPPQPPPPQMAAPVPTQPAPGMTGGGAPVAPKATTRGVAEAAERQIAANIEQEARRTQPVKAAEIDMAQFRSPTGKAKGSIQFFEEMAGALQQRGIGRQTTTPPFEIPYTVSIDELYGYARQADTYENQRRVLDALANNRVTGMGFSTLADRLSGAYRQRYLTNVVSMFPKVAGQPNLIDAIGTVGKAYAAEQLGAARAADIAAGKAEAGVTKTRAQAAQAAAGGQLAAERAVTERETRAAKTQNLLSQGVSRIYDDVLKAAKARRGRGTKAPKINLSEYRQAVTQQFTTEQSRIGRRIDNLDNQIAAAEGAAALADLPVPTRRDEVLNPAEANQRRRDIAKGQVAKRKLEVLKTQREEQTALYNGLADKRAAYDTLHARMALGYRPTMEELEAAGMSANTALELVRSYGGIQSRRRKPMKSEPAKTPAPAPSGKTKIQF